MVVDSSALLAVFLLEPEAGRFVDAMRGAPRPLISAANLLETSIVLDARVQADASAELDQFIADVGPEVEPVTPAQVEVARRAYRLWGRGYHPAALNFGDCFAYALARTTGLPLLYKGDDFPQTDIEPA